MAVGFSMSIDEFLEQVAIEQENTVQEPSTSEQADTRAADSPGLQNVTETPVTDVLDTTSKQKSIMPAVDMKASISPAKIGASFIKEFTNYAKLVNHVFTDVVPKKARSALQHAIKRDLTFEKMGQMINTSPTASIMEISDVIDDEETFIEAVSRIKGTLNEMYDKGDSFIAHSIAYAVWSDLAMSFGAEYRAPEEVEEWSELFMPKRVGIGVTAEKVEQAPVSTLVDLASLLSAGTKATYKGILKTNEINNMSALVKDSADNIGALDELSRAEIKRLGNIKPQTKFARLIDNTPSIRHFTRAQLREPDTLRHLGNRFVDSLAELENLQIKRLDDAIRPVRFMAADGARVWDEAVSELVRRDLAYLQGGNLVFTEGIRAPVVHGMLRDFVRRTPGIKKIDPSSSDFVIDVLGKQDGLAFNLQKTGPVVEPLTYGQLRQSMKAIDDMIGESKIGVEQEALMVVRDKILDQLNEVSPEFSVVNSEIYNRLSLFGKRASQLTESEKGVRHAKIGAGQAFAQSEKSFIKNFDELEGLKLALEETNVGGATAKKALTELQLIEAWWAYNDFIGLNLDYVPSFMSRMGTPIPVKGFFRRMFESTTSGIIKDPILFGGTIKSLEAGAFLGAKSVLFTPRGMRIAHTRDILQQRSEDSGGDIRARQKIQTVDEALNKNRVYYDLNKLQ